MKTAIIIEWNTPEDENWLCPENIELALSSYCKNTEFKVSKIEPLIDEMIKEERMAKDSSNFLFNQSKIEALTELKKKLGEIK